MLRQHRLQLHRARLELVGPGLGRRECGLQARDLRILRIGRLDSRCRPLRLEYQRLELEVRLRGDFGVAGDQQLAHFLCRHLRAQLVVVLVVDGIGLGVAGVLLVAGLREGRGRQGALLRRTLPHDADETVQRYGVPTAVLAGRALEAESLGCRGNKRRIVQRKDGRVGEGHLERKECLRIKSAC